MHHAAGGFVRRNFMMNKKRFASVLMAGCMVGTNVVPAFAAETAALAAATVSATGLRVGIGAGVKAHNVANIQVMAIGGGTGSSVTATWDDAAQQFIFSGAKNGDSLILSWTDENSENNTAEVSIANNKAALKMVSSYADIDAFHCWKGSDNKINVSIPYVNKEGAEPKFMFVPTGTAVTRIEAATGRVLANGVCADGMMTAEFTGLAAGQEYDVYAGSDTDFHKMIGTYNTLTLLTLNTEKLEFEELGGEISAVISLDNAGATKKEEYVLSVYKTLKTPAEGVTLEGFIDADIGFGFLTPIVASGVSVPENLYLWHKDVCIGTLPVTGDVTTVPNPALPVTPEEPANDSKLSLPIGAGLIFAYENGKTSAAATDSLKLTIEEDFVPSFVNSKLALSSSATEVVAVSGLSISNAMVADGAVSMDITASSYDSVKDLSSVYLFYDGAVLGSIEIGAVVANAEKPVFALGADKTVELNFAYNAGGTDTASDAVDIVSSHQAEASKFQLRASKDSSTVLSATFVASSSTVTISVQNSVSEGTYALFYDGDYLGEIEIRKTVSDAPDAAVTVLTSVLSFEFENDASAYDKKSDKVALNITNPKGETISASDFALKVKGADGSLADSDLLRIESYSDAERSLTVSLARGDGDAPQFEAVVLFRGKAVNEADPINVTSMVLPDQSPYLVESIHELVAGSYDMNDDGIPDAELPYRDEYGNDNNRQAEYIQTIVQGWMDQVAAMDGYSDWAGAKINVSYDAETEQFKSVIKVRGAISSAKVWNVTVAAKPVEDAAPSVSLAKITMNRTSKQDLTFNLGSGATAATEASITVQDSSIASVSTSKITAENLKSGLTVTGLKQGSTVVTISFNDAAKTKVEIPVKINALMYNVTTSCGKNGNIDCTSSKFDGTVVEGSTLTFNITPRAGYKVSEVLVDGKSVGSVTSYTLKNIDKNHTIFAKFEAEENKTPGTTNPPETNKDTETKNENMKPDVSHNAGGDITVLSDNVTCLINADKGYIIKKVVANGKSVGAVDYYEFSKTSASNTLVVTFEKAKVEAVTEKDPVVTVTGTTAEDIAPVITTTPIGTTGVGYDYGGSQSRFADIAGHWAEEAIKVFEANGWVSGVSDSTFAPEMNMTRGMFVTILGRMDGGMGMTDCIFTDVDSSKYYANYVQWAFEKGIASGVGENKFAPDANITRQEMAVMVNNYLTNKGAAPAVGGDTFSDSGEIAGWAKDAVNALAQAGFVSGKGNGAFDPKANATRAELVSILFRVNNSLS